MKQCAFLSMENLDAFECYDHLLFEPLATLGWHVKEVPWRDNTVDWDQFDIVVIRSPWDYQNDPHHFLEVITTINASSAHLENSIDIIRWNLDKRYLKEMQTNGVPIVATRWQQQLNAGNLSTFFSFFETDELIIKPIVSANADDTYRINREQAALMEAQLLPVFAQKPLMVQPFIGNIITEGEFSLFYFNGRYSHTILKTPARDDFRVQEEHGGQLKRVEPEPPLRAVGQQTMRALPEIPLYARVDFIRSPENQFQLMELELIEPSLYFNMDPKSPRRFAKALQQRMKTMLK